LRNRKTTKIDSLKEREQLYKLIKKRIDDLVAKEQSEGMTPELRESISVANSLLREIRLESNGDSETYEQLLEEQFGDWARDVQNNKKGKAKVAEECG
jgi:hypothetical protein